MGNAKVVLKSGGVVSLLNDRGVVSELTRRMAPVLAAAKANAPVATGAYQASLHLETVRHGDRTVVRVVASVPYAVGVESRTGNLSRALDQAGGR